MQMTLWQITVTTGYAKQIPTFYLDGQVQGILDENAAIKVARNIIDDPLARISAMAINYNVGLKL